MSELTISQVAASLGVSCSRVQQLCQAGTLPARKFGRDWQISAIALKRYVRRVRSAAGAGPRIGRPHEFLRGEEI